MAEILDETDLQILKTLQKNAKLTTKELADAVHLTPTPVFERQKRLEKKGYIKKYVAILDPEKLDQGLLVFCKVKLTQINHEIADAFVRRIQRIPEVTECYILFRGVSALCGLLSRGASVPCGLPFRGASALSSAVFPAF